MDWTDRIGSRLKLRDLHILLTVLERRGMAKAARHLAISQPVVSRAIADLERGLGVRLLDRTPEGIEPTVYGRTVLNRGLAVFDELRASVKDIKFLSDPESGELRVGSSPAIAGGLVAAILDRLSARRPGIAFEVKVADEDYYGLLRKRDVDLMMGRLATEKENDVNVEVLFRDLLYVVAGIDNPWTRRRNVALKDLVNEPWTMPPLNSNVGALMVDAFRASGLPVPHLAVAGYNHVQTALVGAGRFLTILPGSFLKFNGKRLGLKALPVKLPLPPRPVGIVTLKNRSVSPLTQLFIDCARNMSKPLAEMSA